MQIFKDIDLLDLKNTVVTTGNFDGVHLGHQFLLRQLVSMAHDKGSQSVVVMFYPHPREVLSSGKIDFYYLSSQEDKYRIFEQCGVDVVVQIPFNKELAQWSADDFVKKILVDKLGMSLFLVGYDHRLGNPKSDTRVAPLAEKYGFKMKECRSFVTEVGNVSSSIVREHILTGKVKQATLLLGRPYAMKCTVVEGEKVGRSIGYPTANLVPIYEKHVVPLEGVYVVQVQIGSRMFGGMLQIGHRPTLDDGRGRTVEVHIFDFNDNIYGQEVDVFFVKFIRLNQRFESLEDLKAQLRDDELSARQILLIL